MLKNILSIIKLFVLRNTNYTENSNLLRMSKIKSVIISPLYAKLSRVATSCAERIVGGQDLSYIIVRAYGIRANRNYVGKNGESD